MRCFWFYQSSWQLQHLQRQAQAAEKYTEFKAVFDDEVPAIILSQEKVNYLLSKDIKGATEIKNAVTAGDRFLNIKDWVIQK